MRAGAERICMPAPTVEQFVDAVKSTVLANKHWVIGHYVGSLKKSQFSVCILSLPLLAECHIAMLQVPPPDKGFLHIRPLLLGNGPVLSVTPAPEFTFLIYVTPVGNYFEVYCCLISYSECMKSHALLVRMKGPI